ncbi:ARM repeat-containing protein [Caulochytrium protostelioides]|uniref:ARM repeat-containing protein n=1 Tax=Caulochytrium protostelioides TaxID=1555241 RepID=A0A4P9X1A2_9FUNG|nr:ARM repeat-containing protein [Caulochytrium protostelioides]
MVNFTHNVLQGLTSPSEDDQVTTARYIKNAIIGNRTKKDHYLQLGIAERLVEILRSPSAALPLRVNAATVLGSFAFNAPENVERLQRAGAPAALLSTIHHVPPSLAEAASRSLRSLWQTATEGSDILYEPHRPLIQDVIQALNPRRLLAQHASSTNATEATTALSPDVSPQVAANLIENSAGILACTTINHDRQNMCLEYGALPYLGQLITPTFDAYPRMQLAAMAALAAISHRNPLVANRVAGMSAVYEGRSIVRVLRHLAKSPRPLQSLLAIACLAQLLHARGLPRRFPNDYHLDVIPTLIRLMALDHAGKPLAPMTPALSQSAPDPHISNTAQTWTAMNMTEKDASASNKEAVDPLSTADLGDIKYTPEQYQLFIRAPAIFAYLVDDQKVLQEAALDCGGVTALTKLLTHFCALQVLNDTRETELFEHIHRTHTKISTTKPNPGEKTLMTPPVSVWRAPVPGDHAPLPSTMPLLCPDGSLPPAKDDDLQDPNSLRYHLNHIGYLPYSLPTSDLNDLVIQNTLLALAAVCSLKEECRKAIIDQGMLAFTVRAMTHPKPGIRSAACQFARSLSRSVKNLRTSLIDVGIDRCLLNLIQDESLPVRITATATLCNLVLDFSPMKSTVLNQGGVEVLVKLTESTNVHLRLNCVWALKNLLYNANTLIMQRVLTQLGLKGIARLLNDPDLAVQEQVLTLLRNLVCGNHDEIDYVFAELGQANLISNIESKLVHLPQYDEVLLQTLYIIANIAAGHVGHKDAIINSPVILERIRMNLTHRQPTIRAPAVWCIINLTWPHDQGFAERIQKLRRAGVEKVLNSIGPDINMDVRELVKLARCHFSLCQSDGSLRPAHDDDDPFERRGASGLPGGPDSMGGGADGRRPQGDATLAELCRLVRPDVSGHDQATRLPSGPSHGMGRGPRPEAEPPFRSAASLTPSRPSDGETVTTPSGAPSARAAGDARQPPYPWGPGSAAHPRGHRYEDEDDADDWPNAEAEFHYAMALRGNNPEPWDDDEEVDEDDLDAVDDDDDDDDDGIDNGMDRFHGAGDDGPSAMMASPAINEMRAIRASDGTVSMVPVTQTLTSAGRGTTRRRGQAGSGNASNTRTDPSQSERPDWF